MPFASGVAVPCLAVSLNYLHVTNLPDRLEAHIRQIGELPGDLLGTTRTEQVAGSNAEHFPFFELPKLPKRGRIVSRSQMRFEQAIEFTKETFFSSRKSQGLGIQARNPMGMRYQRSAQRL